MNLIDFIALPLAVRALLDAWFWEDSILATARASSEIWENRFFRKLANCAFCISYHLPWVLMASCWAWSLFVETPWDVLLKSPIYSLAVTQLVRLLEDFTPGINESGDVSTKRIEHGPEEDEGRGGDAEQSPGEL